MSNHHEDNRDRLLLLNKVKAQYEPGPMRYRLYEVFEVGGNKLPEPSYEWMYYAGMGDVDLHPAQPKEVKAAKKQIEEGYLVPTFEEDFYGVKTIRLIQHFDDVKFGFSVTDPGEIIIYDFMPVAERPDRVITPDAKHDAAIALLKKRIGYKTTITDDPIQLRGGPIVFPIITDTNAAELRKRQKELRRELKVA